MHAGRQGRGACRAGQDHRRDTLTTTGFSDQSAYCSPILITRGGLRLVVTITARYVVGVEADTGRLPGNTLRH